MKDVEQIRIEIPDGETFHAAFEVVITKRPSTVPGFFMYRTKVRGLLTGITAEREGPIPEWDLIRALRDGAAQLAEHVPEEDQSTMINAVSSPYAPPSQ